MSYLNQSVYFQYKNRRKSFPYPAKLKYYVNTLRTSDEEAVEVHPMTSNPTKAWKEISKSQKFFKINYKSPKNFNTNPRKIRIVCMSDTHSLYHYIKFQVPNGDIFIHAGNFTAGGKLDEVIAFNNWLGNLPHMHKLVIAGNHELSFDDTIQINISTNSTKHNSGLIDKIPFIGKNKDKSGVGNIRNYLTNCTYLEDSCVELYGIKFYGTPWQPEFGPWAFGLKRGQELLNKWNLIPSDIDILITHTPPIGFCDKTANGKNKGCVELLTSIQKRIKPKYSIFGHVHDAYGIMTDAKTIFINASTCDMNYMPNNYPVVFDIEIKDDELDSYICERSENEEKVVDKVEINSKTNDIVEEKRSWCWLM